MDGRRAPRARAATPRAFRVKAPKAAGRTLRRGAAFVVLRADGCVLVRTRPPRGLLGGMTEVPTTRVDARFRRRAMRSPRRRVLRGRSRDGAALPASSRMSFTHFPLELAVYVAEVRAETPPPAGMRWVARADLAGEALPNLMRKVLAHALE